MCTKLVVSDTWLENVRNSINGGALDLVWQNTMLIMKTEHHKILTSGKLIFSMW